MTDCTTEPLLFSSLKRKSIQADFRGGRLTSDGGALLLREVDRSLGLIDAINACIRDPRNPFCTVHSQRTLLAQRIFGIVLGYEDLNDHQGLREDPLFQVLSERGGRTCRWRRRRPCAVWKTVWIAKPWARSPRCLSRRSSALIAQRPKN